MHGSISMDLAFMIFTVSQEKLIVYVKQTPDVSWKTIILVMFLLRLIFEFLRDFQYFQSKKKLKDMRDKNIYQTRFEKHLQESSENCQRLPYHCQNNG